MSTPGGGKGRGQGRGRGRGRGGKGRGADISVTDIVTYRPPPAEAVDQEVCVICISSMNPAVDRMVALQCNHRFHFDCMNGYAMSTGRHIQAISCPTCRMFSLEPTAVNMEQTAVQHRSTFDQWFAEAQRGESRLNAHNTSRYRDTITEQMHNMSLDDLERSLVQFARMIKNQIPRYKASNERWLRDTFNLMQQRRFGTDSEESDNHIRTRTLIDDRMNGIEDRLDDVMSLLNNRGLRRPTPATSSSDPNDSTSSTPPAPRRARLSSAERREREEQRQRMAEERRAEQERRQRERLQREADLAEARATAAATRARIALERLAAHNS